MVKGSTPRSGGLSLHFSLDVTNQPLDFDEFYSVFKLQYLEITFLYNHSFHIIPCTLLTVA